MECSSRDAEPAAMRLIFDLPPHGIPPYNPFPGPYWPFPQLSVGDVHGVFLQRLVKTLLEKRNGARTLRSSVAELAATGILGREEIGHLNRLASIAESEEELDQIVKALRELRVDILASRPMATIALACTSIGIDSFAGPLARVRGGGIGKADVDGALGGAAVGAILGGPVGGFWGALIGGIAFSLEKALETDAKAGDL